jgi:hypothetical protein
MIKLGLLCANAQRKQQNTKYDVNPWKGVILTKDIDQEFKAINFANVKFFGSII